jgi:hypothetical protein
MKSFHPEVLGAAMDHEAEDKPYEFNVETWRDSLIKWIVCDDQVCFQFE